MKRMLFNATHAEELRVAIVDGQKLIDLDLESAIRSEKKGNIYKGVVTKVEPSLEACFVDYGAEKQGFLPLKEIYRAYFTKYSGKTAISDIKIEAVIKEGQEMIVQVDKDERGTKGAALTTFVSLAGRFLVLMPNNPKGGGISRRIAGEERHELKQILNNLNVDSRHSLIARTEGIGRDQSELQWDLDFLVKLWNTIEEASQGIKAPFLIYQESNLIVRSIRDHLSEDISEVIVDDAEVFERAKRFINQVMPQSMYKLIMYSDSVPLFSRYQIEGQIDSAFNREVNLPSGGSISIDHTEALIAIDVNSARATKGGDIEETALHTNLEAVEEVARQLKIRDMGGLVVIDLIDMTYSKNQRAVESRLKDALQGDRARVQVGNISRFGLLEMSRQRLRSSISEANYLVCPRCDGMGTIRSVVSSSLNLLRLIEDEALKENTEAIQVVLPLDMATYLLNEKRHELNHLEARLASRIIIIPSHELASPHFQIKRLRSEELDELTGVASYEQKVGIDKKEESPTDSLKSNKKEYAQVQVDQINHRAPPPTAKPTMVKQTAVAGQSAGGLWSKVKSIFAGEVNSDAVLLVSQAISKIVTVSEDEKEKQEQSKKQGGQQRRRSHSKPGNQQNRDRGRGGNNQGRNNSNRGQQGQNKDNRDNNNGGSRGQQNKAKQQAKNTRSNQNRSNTSSDRRPPRNNQNRSNPNQDAPGANQDGQNKNQGNVHNKSNSSSNSNVRSGNPQRRSAANQNNPFDVNTGNQANVGARPNYSVRPGIPSNQRPQADNNTDNQAGNTRPPRNHPQQSTKSTITQNGNHANDIPDDIGNRK